LSRTGLRRGGAAGRAAQLGTVVGGDLFHEGLVVRATARKKDGSRDSGSAGQRDGSHARLQLR